MMNIKRISCLLLLLLLTLSLTACLEISSQSSTKPALTMHERLTEIGYTSDDADGIEQLLNDVGILDADDMWTITHNGTLQANALTYNGHQINFTTDNNVCFYIQATGWEKELSYYGWYISAWSGKLKFGYNTQTKKYYADLYAVNEDGSGGYIAIYDASSDSVRPYDE